MTPATHLLKNQRYSISPRKKKDKTWKMMIQEDDFPLPPIFQGVWAQVPPVHLPGCMSKAPRFLFGVSLRQISLRYNGIPRIPGDDRGKVVREDPFQWPCGRWHWRLHVEGLEDLGIFFCFARRPVLILMYYLRMIYIDLYTFCII